MHWGNIRHIGHDSVIQRHSTNVIAIDLAAELCIYAVN